MSVHVDHQTEKSDNHLGDVGNNENPSEGATKGEVQGEGPSTIGGMVVPLTACRVRGWGEGLPFGESGTTLTWAPVSMRNCRPRVWSVTLNKRQR